MNTRDDHPIRLEPDTPLAVAVARGREAFMRADLSGGDAAYRQAVGLAAAQNPELWSALTIDHVATLVELRCPTLALQRCNEYLREARADNRSLRLLRAEILAWIGDHRGADVEATAIRMAVQGTHDSLSLDDDARLHRVEALAAVDRGDLDRAAQHLDAAQQAFHAAGNLAGEQEIHHNRLTVGVWLGDESEISDEGPPQTHADHLRFVDDLAIELRPALTADIPSDSDVETSVQSILARLDEHNDHIGKPLVEPQQRTADNDVADDDMCSATGSGTHGSRPVPNPGENIVVADRRPRVFVSYAHDSGKHKRAVQRFCTVLRDHCGIDVHIDRMYKGDRRDWTLWAKQQIEAADFVAVVASPEYKLRAEQRVAPGEVRGAQFEAAILRDKLNKDLAQWTRKIVPVVLPGRSVSEIPDFVQSHAADHYLITDFTNAGMTRLLEALNGPPQSGPSERSGAHRMETNAGASGEDSDPFRQITLTASATGSSNVQQAAGDVGYQSPRVGGKRIAMLIVVFATVAIAVGTWAVRPEPGWHEVLHQDSLELIAQDFACTSVEDKVDLDTGKRGRGEQPQLPGCPTEGGLADLIVDPNEIHTASTNRESLLWVASSTTLEAETCSGMLEEQVDQLVSSITLDSLTEGDQICVKTDEGRIARVRFTKVDDSAVTIDFVTWEKQ